MNKNINFRKGRMNRVLLLIILIIIVIIAIIGILNNKGKTNNIFVEIYGDKEIKTLLNKGFDSMKNYSVEEYSFKTGKLNKEINIKGNIRKISSIDKGYLLIDLDLKNKVVVDANKKIAIEMKISEIENINDLKYSPFILENELSENVKYEYLKKENYKNKDCIVVKQKYNNSSEMDTQSFRVFWIEEKTGYIIGIGEMYNSKDEIIENVYYDNIKINELTDSDFETPEDYKIIEKY